MAQKIVDVGEASIWPITHETFTMISYKPTKHSQVQSDLLI